MVYTIDEFKGQVSKSRGFARPNLFRVFLPPINSNTRELDLICKAAALPGRQITSIDNQIGAPLRKVANGYATTDISLSFYVMNDYTIKKYFDTWQAMAHNNSTHETNYYTDYVKNIKIQNLQAGNVVGLMKKQLGVSDKVPTFVLNRLPNITGSLGPLEGSIDLAQGEATLNLGQDDISTYEVELLECYPTTVSEIQLGNEIDGVMELTVQLSYVNWTSDYTNPRDDLFTSIFGGLVQLIRNRL